MSHQRDMGRGRLEPTMLEVKEYIYHGHKHESPTPSRGHAQIELIKVSCAFAFRKQASFRMHMHSYTANFAVTYDTECCNLTYWLINL